MTEIPTPDIDAILQERLDEARAKMNAVVHTAKNSLDNGYDELTVFLSIARAVEVAAFKGPQALNQMMGALAAAVIQLAKAQMED